MECFIGSVTTYGGIETVNGKIDALLASMTEVKRDIVDIKETNGAHGKAIDKDAKTIIDHESRIKKLELIG